MDKPIVWSCGGGTQSAAIAALIVLGRLPKPDYAVMVDTEREKTGTWEYVNNVLIPSLSSVGVELEVVKKSSYAKEDLYFESEDGEQTLLLPVFTTHSGTISKLPTYCSSKWKARVYRRFLKKEKGLKRGGWVNWMGMSTDEMRRVRVCDEDKNENVYPLISIIPMDRAGCRRFVEEELGWPRPPRSACWQCPNQGDPEWSHMKRFNPDDFANAVEMDYKLREKDPTVFLHKSCKPLDEVEFGEFAGEEDGVCDSGMCFV